jgi:cytoskeletal protein CcmA (bactofilin family)
LFSRKKVKSSISSYAHLDNNDLSIVGTSVKITGDIVTSGSIRIDGKVQGNVLAEGNLILGNNGEINGNISGGSINLGGKVNGSVNAVDNVTLESDCSLNGDITSRILIIESGAFFNGKSKMGTPEQED